LWESLKNIFCPPTPCRRRRFFGTGGGMPPMPIKIDRRTALHRTAHTHLQTLPDTVSVFAYLIST